MRLATFLAPDAEQPLAGEVRDGRVVSFAEHVTVKQLLAGGELGIADGTEYALEAITLLAPVPDPGAIYGIGLNYASHAREQGVDPPAQPIVFTKVPTAVAPPGGPVRCPAVVRRLDYEGELVVVIGETTRRVARERALDAVAGYAVGNDVTMRDYQYKTHQWLQGKAWDASTPVGPWMVSAEELGDPQGLTLRTTVNGPLVQESSTELTIFDIATLVSVISEFTALHPGDLIFTGTPSSVGFRREPQLLLGDGDVVAVEIERVGRIENRMVSET